MADVFISYSRRDARFVHALHDFLTADGRDAWVDWQDIPPASEWEREIGASIDAADSFVFVISRHSLASEYCATELARAETGGKRVVPIACDHADPAAAPAALRQLNWIWCRDGDDRDAAFALLARALDTDLEWARAHTRLLVRAVEWNERRDASLLLRGRDLEDAARALAANSAKEPAPTELQQRFVLASRQSAARRQRFTLGGVTVALVVALALALVAFLQRSSAIRARDSATSLALASAAADQLAGNLEISLLLGLEAYRASPSVQAENRMISALEAARGSGVRTILRGHEDGVGGVAFSRDGRSLASAGFDGTVRLWDLRTPARVGRPLTNGEQYDRSVAFSPDGRTLASVGGNGIVRLWDARTHTLLARLPNGGDEFLQSVAFSPDGRTLAAAGGGAVLWDVRTRKRLGTVNGGIGTYAVAFSPDGRRLATAGEDGRVKLWDVRTRTRIGRPLRANESSVESIAFSPDGRTLVSGGDDGTVRLWSVRTHAQLGRALSGHRGSVNGVAISPDGNLLASAGDDGTVRVWDVGTQAQRREPLRGHRRAVFSVAFGPDGRTVASAGEDGTVRIWNVRGHTRLDRLLNGRQETVRDLAFSPDGRILATGGEDGTVRLWNAPESMPLGFLDAHHGRVDAVAFSPDGRTLATAGARGKVRLWDTGTRATVGRPLDGRQGSVRDLAFSPDGRLLAAAGENGTVVLWNVRQPTRRPWRLDGRQGAVWSVAFSPDGETLASAGGSGAVGSMGSTGYATVRLWDVSTHARIGRPMDTTEGFFVGVSFSRDGRTLAAAGKDGTVWLWRVSSQAQVGAPKDTGHGVFAGAAFSRDGRKLAALDEHGATWLWDVPTHTQLGQPLRSRDRVTGTDGSVFGLAFSPDGSTLASAGANGSTQLWDGILWRDRDDLTAQVCGLVVGNLTQHEWAVLAPGLAYRSTCPS